MSDQTSPVPPMHIGEPTNQAPPSQFTLASDAPDRAPLLGTYRASLELATMQGAIVNARVTVEGSALVVEQVLAAAAAAFREDAER